MTPSLEVTVNLMNTKDPSQLLKHFTLLLPILASTRLPIWPSASLRFLSLFSLPHFSQGCSINLLPENKLHHWELFALED